jgi:formylmethanofuran dehydrogenase subunit B
MMGIDPLSGLTAAAIGHFRLLLLIALSPRIAFLAVPAAVAITTSLCANPAGGTAFRFDGPDLPVRQLISSSFPDEFQVLKRLDRALRRMAAP